MTLPTLEYELTTADGKDGWTASWFAHKSDDSMEPVSEVYKEQYVDETRCFISDGAPKGITKRWSLKLQGKLKPRAQDCDFEFGLTSAGRAKACIKSVHASLSYLPGGAISFMLMVNSSLTTGHVKLVEKLSLAVAQPRTKVSRNSKLVLRTTFSSSFAMFAHRRTGMKTKR